MKAIDVTEVLEQYGVETVAELLDETLFEYATYCLRKVNEVPPEADVHLHLLQGLKRAFAAAARQK